MLIMLRRGANVELQIALRRGAEQIQQCAGRVVAAAAVAELGDVDHAAARWIAGDFVGQRRVEALLFAFGLAVGGVGEHVDADRERIGDVLLDRLGILGRPARAGEFPVAGEIFVRIDDAGAAAVFDASQLAGVGRIGTNDVLHPPDRMAGRERLQFVFGLGKDGGHQLAERGVESARDRCSRLRQR